MRVWKALAGGVHSVAFSPDGTGLAVAGPAGVKLFDAADGRERWHADRPGNVPRVSFAEGGREVVALAGLRLVVLGSADGRELARHSRRIATFAVPPEPESLLVLTAGMDNTELRQLTLMDGTVCGSKVLRYHGGVTRMELSPDGRTAGTVGAWEGMLLDVGTQTVRFAQRMKADDARPAALAFSPDGGTFVFAERAAVHVCDVGRAEARTGTRFDGPAVRDMAFRRDGKAVFVVRGTPTVEERDARSWAVTRVYDWNAGKLSCLAVSPDGTLASAGSASGAVVVWDVDL